MDMLGGSLVTTTWCVLGLWKKGCLQLWKVAMNALNQQPQTYSKKWSSNGLFARSSDLGGFFG
jgi:hypothetical protein